MIKMTQPLVHYVGWSLLHFLWEGAIVALLLTSALRLLSNRSSQLRYTAACCALVLMAASPPVTFGLLGINSRTADRPSRMQSWEVISSLFQPA
jgi:hypothetical protein